MNKNDLERFFEDRAVAREVKLTNVEGEALALYETMVESLDGLNFISGGFAKVVLTELDEENPDIIHGKLKSGVQNDCEDRVTTDPLVFNRKTRKVSIT